jgi:hypothetical protein
LENGRWFNQASFTAIAALASARLVNRSLRRLANSHRSAISTPASTLALSRGRPALAGMIAVP